MITYDKITRNSYNQLKILYNKLHQELNNPKITKYKYLGNGQFYPPNLPKQSGLYIMFDTNENRIVRVGKAEKSLLTRLTQHFIKEDKDHSILRKHIVRCLLNQQNQPLEDWDTKGIENPMLEKQVTKYLINNITFCVIPLINIEEIKKLEQTLIEVLSMYNRLHKEITGNPIQSKNWLGNYCSNNKVKTYGLWNDEHIRNWKKY